MKKLFLILISLVSLSIGLKAAEVGPHEGAARALTKTAADYGMEHLPGPIWRVVATYLNSSPYSSFLSKTFELSSRHGTFKKAFISPIEMLDIESNTFLQLRHRWDGLKNIYVDCDNVLVLEFHDKTFYRLLGSLNFELLCKEGTWSLEFLQTDSSYPRNFAKEYLPTIHNNEHPEHQLSLLQKPGKTPYIKIETHKPAYNLIHQLFPASSNAAAGKDERKDS